MFPTGILAQIYGGTGLGLRVTFKLVHCHDGTGSWTRILGKLTVDLRLFGTAVNVGVGGSAAIMADSPKENYHPNETQRAQSP